MSTAEPQAQPLPQPSPHASSQPLPQSLTQPLTQIDRYTIERKLSQGGMAEVFLAHRNVAGFAKRVVVKSVLPGFQSDPSFRAMMLNEAKIAAGLCHSNIVQVEDLLEVDGRPFIVMEYLDGQNLREILNRAVKADRTLSLPFVCTVMASVLAGLGHAHDRVDADGRSLGLIHRDVSLSNVIVTWSGQVKLIDFGIAKATCGDDDGLTRAGQLKGKGAYMSPEQVRHEPLDRRTDLFSAGVLLWELLTRRRLFWRRNDLDSMVAICEEDAPPPSSVVESLPPELDAICKKALERDRAKRYQSADEMLQDLEEVRRSHHWGESSQSLRSELGSLFPAESAILPAAASLPLRAAPVEKPEPPEPPKVSRAAALASAVQRLLPAEHEGPSVQLLPLQRARSAEILLLDAPTPGPSVYDDLENTMVHLRPARLWSAMLLFVAGTLLLAAAVALQ